MGDSTLRFVRDGYLFGTRGFRAAASDHFRTRLLGRPVLVMRGLEATRFFYEGGRFRREGAMPRSVLTLLQDEGSVQALEEEAHRRRKELFLGLATGAYNDFVGSLESQVLTQAKRFETLKVETGGKTIEPMPIVEASPRPLTKLVAIDQDEEPTDIAAE